MTEVMWFLNIGVLAVELIISLVIIYVFSSEMRKNRVKVYRPVIALGTLILLQEIVSIYIYYGFSLKYGIALSVPLFIINLFGIAVLIILYRILSP
ncbi:hypothetical protein [Cuniculiplasma divulgatum]|uniref:Multipass membrane protein n=1 Tax=Cuniculiplasma divulgatum TaxID=1673428 RepID=A0A1N5UMA8_9ARCH|nr:hypothetical protein [Cuniculiplasma divulgatum]SIM61750.1 multipass membrane protein [Cuniculiplasma divulgatum]SJK84867.1 multipass membrane protein [Cuniculiplasma divulgatum]